MTREEMLKQAVEEVLKPLDDGFQISDVWDIITAIMENAEFLTIDEDKKKFALEVLDIVLRKIDLPGPDFITRRVIMWFAPSLVDKFVSVAKGIFSFGTTKKAA